MNSSIGLNVVKYTKIMTFPKFSQISRNQNKTKKIKTIKTGGHPGLGPIITQIYPANNKLTIILRKKNRSRLEAFASSQIKPQGCNSTSLKTFIDL